MSRGKLPGKMGRRLRFWIAHHLKPEPQVNPILTGKAKEFRWLLLLIVADEFLPLDEGSRFSTAGENGSKTSLFEDFCDFGPFIALDFDAAFLHCAASAARFLHG